MGFFKKSESELEARVALLEKQIQTLCSDHSLNVATIGARVAAIEGDYEELVRKVDMHDIAVGLLRSPGAKEQLSAKAQRELNNG